MKSGFKKLYCIITALLLLFNIPNVPFCVKAIEQPSTTIEKVLPATPPNGSNGNVVVTQEILQAMINQQVKTAKSDKSALATFLLAFFVGILGIHRFYVGKIGTGILYLFTGGFLGIGWFVDLIKIACGVFTDYRGLPIEF